jgi:hypothetical protein
MFARIARALPRDYARWGAYALLLLAPGSFVTLPVAWLIRRYTATRSAT